MEWMAWKMIDEDYNKQELRKQGYFCKTNLSVQKYIV